MSIVTDLLFKDRLLGFTNARPVEFDRGNRCAGLHNVFFGIVLSLGVVGISSVVPAQPLSGDAVESSWTRLSSGDLSGWWSPTRAEFQARPTLLVMASANTQAGERSAVSGAGASNLSRNETVCDAPASTISDSSTGNCRSGLVLVASLARPTNGLAEVAAFDSKAGAKTANAASSPYSLMAQLKKMPSSELYPGLFLSTAQTESMLQGQSLAKTAVADETGTHFKPLAEVDLGGRRFPIFLYSPSASGPTQGR